MFFEPNIPVFIPLLDIIISPFNDSNSSVFSLNTDVTYTKSVYLAILVIINYAP